MFFPRILTYLIPPFRPSFDVKTKTFDIVSQSLITNAVFVLDQIQILTNFKIRKGYHYENNEW